GNGTAFALYAVDREGLEELEVGGADSVTSGDYTLTLFVAGDVNQDGKVDGQDGVLLSQALGTHAGQAGYTPAADANRDGQVDAADVHLLAADLGFAANQPPVVTAGQALTHQDLEASIDLTPLASDPEDDPVYFRVVAAQHGTAVLGVDGHTVTFRP